MENEIELSLELSIGGCYAKSEREKGSLSDEIENAAQNDAAAESGCDLQRRREMQAMKRREARMKREFKKSRGMMMMINGCRQDKVEEKREREGAAPAPKREKSSNASSSFGENKVSWGLSTPIGNGFACPSVGEGGETNHGQQPPPSSSHHRSTSHKGEYDDTFILFLQLCPSGTNCAAPLRVDSFIDLWVVGGSHLMNFFTLVLLFFKECHLVLVEIIHY